VHAINRKNSTTKNIGNDERTKTEEIDRIQKKINKMKRECNEW